jgi:arylsulfatase A-like enzyme
MAEPRSGPGRRGPLALAALLACAGGLALWRGTAEPERPAAPAPGVTSASAPGRPNVVWILLDACRADHLSAYGYARRTSPALAALAARGALFERNYAQGSNTLLSVGSFMTGRHFPTFYQDFRHLEISFLKLPAEDEKLISTLLGEASYHTAMFNASPWYTAESRLARSFDEFHQLHYGAAEPTPNYARRNPELFRWLEQNAGHPFFAYVHLLDTHEPRYVNNTRSTWLDPGFPAARDQELRGWPVEGPFSPADQRHLVDLYDGGVAYADSVVGELLAKLEQLQLTERTVVVVSADHGELLAEDGATLGHPGNSSYDQLLHTPLILAGPGIPRGRRVGIRTENADIVPTLVDLLGVQKGNARFDGRSLRPSMQAANPVAVHDYIFARVTSYLLHTRPTSLLIYEDVKFDIAALEAEELRAWGLPVRPREQAWVMPDRLGARRPAQVSTERWAAVRALMAGPLEQAWQVHDSRPVEVPPYFGIMQGGTVTENAESPELDFHDDRWTRKQARTAMRLGESTLLITDPKSEQAPAMVMGVAVPNGTYRVSLYTTTSPALGTGRGVSFQFQKYPEEPAFRMFSIPASRSSEPNTAWLELGTYTIADGGFRYLLKPGRPEDLTVVGSFRFTNTAAATTALPTEQQLREEMQRLKATGYAN